MPAPFPHHYAVTLQLDDVEHAEGTLTTAEVPVLRVGPPPLFDGRSGHHGPEDLLLAALASCHMSTSVVLARRKGVPLKSYSAETSGTLEKTSEGIVFTSIHLRVEASTDSGREEELEHLIERAEGHCIISKALRLEVELEVVVSAAAR